MNAWKEWWGEKQSGPKPTGFVEVRDARGVTRKGSAGSFQWQVLGHIDDIRYYRENSPGTEYGFS